jgi:Rod binding domain-containing protein
MAVNIINNNAKMVGAANEFVNNVFYGTLLRQFRDAQQPSLFDKGPGGSSFLRMLDTELIKRMSSRGVSPVAKSVINQLGKSQNPTRVLPNARKHFGTASATVGQFGKRGFADAK